MQQLRSVVALCWVRKGGLKQLHTLWFLLPDILVSAKDPSDGQQLQARGLGSDIRIKREEVNLSW